MTWQLSSHAARAPGSPSRFATPLPRAEATAGRSRADAAHPREVVRRIAAQRREVAVLIRADAEQQHQPLGGEQRRRLDPAVDDPQDRGRLVDERERVAVGGDDDGAATGRTGGGGGGGEHVVGLQAGRHHDRDAELAEHGYGGGELRDERVELLGSVGLVLRPPLAAQ
jgi:hypothetical protein